MNLEQVHHVATRIKKGLFKNVGQNSLGRLRSKIRGIGLQFKEHQVYHYGDDVRFIDWKITAKTGVPFIKTFEEERNIEIVIILDFNSSMLLGYQGVSKLQVALEICCLLYLIADANKDRVHVYLVGDQVVDVPGQSGMSGILRIISELNRLKILDDYGKINTHYKLQGLVSMEEKVAIFKKNIQKKRQIVVLSDFFEFLPSLQLQQILKNRNVHAFRVVSPIDLLKKIPFSFMAYHSCDYTSARANFFLNDTTSVVSDMAELFSKRVKTIAVQDAYLEKFIKELA